MKSKNQSRRTRSSLSASDCSPPKAKVPKTSRVHPVQRENIKNNNCAACQKKDASMRVMEKENSDLKFHVQMLQEGSRTRNAGLEELCDSDASSLIDSFQYMSVEESDDSSDSNGTNYSLDLIQSLGSVSLLPPDVNFLVDCLQDMIPSQKIAFLRQIVQLGVLDDVCDQTLGKKLERKLSPPKNAAAKAMGPPCCPKCKTQFTDFKVFGYHCTGPHRKAYKSYSCGCTRDCKGGKPLEYSDLRGVEDYVEKSIRDALATADMCQWKCVRKIYKKAHNGVPAGQEDIFWQLECRDVKWTRCNECKSLYKYHTGASGYRRKHECQNRRKTEYRKLRRPIAMPIA